MSECFKDCNLNATFFFFKEKLQLVINLPSPWLQRDADCCVVKIQNFDCTVNTADAKL